MDFLDANAVAQKLDTTICLYNGKPVYVTTEGLLVSLHYYPSENSEMTHKMDISANDSLLSWSDIRLGFAFFMKSAYYVSRRPARQFKLGISRGNISCRSLSGARLKSVEVALASGNIAIFKTIEGVYPSFEEAMGILYEDEECSSVPVSREFAIKSEEGMLSLFHRSNMIGVKAPGRERFNLIDVPEYTVIASLLEKNNLERIIQ